MNNNFGAPPSSLGFGESITTCFKKYFIFEGRAGLGEFWYFHLFQLILGVIVSLFLPPLIANILLLFFYIPMLAVGCRRLHDVNKSGWLQLLAITVIGIIPLIIWFATDGIDKETKSNKSLKYKKAQVSYKDRDLTDELEELKELYEDGTLSETQFRKAKKKLLK